jgi:hypothetical protein
MTMEPRNKQVYIILLYSLNKISLTLATLRISLQLRSSSEIPLFAGIVDNFPHLFHTKNFTF